MARTSNSPEENLINWNKSLDTSTPGKILNEFIKKCGVNGKISREEFEACFQKKDRDKFSRNIGQMTGKTSAKEGTSHSVRPFYKEDNRYALHDDVKEILMSIPCNIEQEKNNMNEENHILNLYGPDKIKLKARVELIDLLGKKSIFFESNGGKGDEGSNPHYSDAIALILKILNNMGINRINAYHAPYKNVKGNMMINEDMKSVDRHFVARKLKECGGPPNGPISIQPGDGEFLNIEKLVHLCSSEFAQEYLPKQTRSHAPRTNSTSNQEEQNDCILEDKKTNKKYLYLILGILSGALCVFVIMSLLK